MEKVLLYAFENDVISISMELYFNEQDQLYFDGYDRGKRVSELWGDSDFEYTYTIDPREVNKFYRIFKLKKGDRAGLLKALKQQFSHNKAYTLFGEFMQEHNIKYKGFTWM